MLANKQLSDLNSISPETRLKNESSVGVVATVSSSYFSKLRIELALSQDKQQWTLRGDVQKLFYSSQWADLLPKQWSEWLVQLSGFSGNVTAEFGVEKPRGEEAKFSFLGSIENGRLQHPKLPYPLEGLEGTLHYRNQLLQLRQATARSGQAQFQLEADVYGLALGAPMVAQLKATNLPLDDRLLRAVPAAIQEQWLKFNLAGTVDTELTLQYDGKQWNPEVVVHARNGSVNADVFPYPLANVQGDFHYRDGILISEAMTATANGKVIRGVLRLARASPKCAASRWTPPPKNARGFATACAFARSSETTLRWSTTWRSACARRSRGACGYGPRGAALCRATQTNRQKRFGDC